MLLKNIQDWIKVPVWTSKSIKEAKKFGLNH